MSEQDPAVEQWRDATTKSTGAQLRDAVEANEALTVEHAKACAELERLREVLRQTCGAAYQLIHERDELRAEIDALRRRIAGRTGTHVLTEKGLAALDRGEEGT